MLNRGWLAAAAAVTMGLTASAPAGAAVIADNGFTSAADGYSFQNYGNEPGVADLIANDIRRMFGPDVCIPGSDPCRLTPEAARWMESTNSHMSDGHCYGMATTAQNFFMGTQEPPTPDLFGADTVPGLAFDGNSALQSHIAYAWTLQSLPSVFAQRSNLTPKGVVTELVSALTPGAARYVLTIEGPQGGHAITPTAVESAGAGKRLIRVYDNNWPGQTRYVHVDTRKNTWRYRLAPNLVWSGNARTKSLALADPAPGFGRQPCFICPAKAGKASPGRTVELRLTPEPRSGRHGSVRVIDARGRYSGCGRGGCVNDIPGVELRRLATVAPPWKTSTPPVFELPTRHAYTVRFGPTSRSGKVRESVEVIGRGFSLGAERVTIRKGETDSVKIARRARKVSFHADGRGVERPELVLSSSNMRGGNAYEVAVEPGGIDPGAKLEARLRPRARDVRLVNRGGARREKVNVALIAFTADGTTAKSKTVKLRGGRGMTLDLPAN